MGIFDRRRSDRLGQHAATTVGAPSPHLAPAEAPDPGDDPFLAGYRRAVALEAAGHAITPDRAQAELPSQVAAPAEWLEGFRARAEAFDAVVPPHQRGYRAAGMRCFDNPYTAPEDAEIWAGPHLVGPDRQAFIAGFSSYFDHRRPVKRRPAPVRAGQRVQWLNPPGRLANERFGRTVTIDEVLPRGVIVITDPAGRRHTIHLSAVAADC